MIKLLPFIFAIFLTVINIPEVPVEDRFLIPPAFWHSMTPERQAHIKNVVWGDIFRTNHPTCEEITWERCSETRDGFTLLRFDARCVRHGQGFNGSRPVSE
jgi:hypothetical protein